jgi:hypothetical protein
VSQRTGSSSSSPRGEALGPAPPVGDAALAPPRDGLVADNGGDRGDLGADLGDFGDLDGGALAPPFFGDLGEEEDVFELVGGVFRATARAVSAARCMDNGGEGRFGDAAGMFGGPSPLGGAVAPEVMRELMELLPLSSAARSRYLCRASSIISSAPSSASVRSALARSLASRTC